MKPMIGHGEQRVIERDDLDQLLTAIARRGFRLIGPTVRDGAIVYDDISSSADLPAGWTDEQDGGHYRLLRRDDEALFGYAVGPQSWKRYLFPSTSVIWRSGEGAVGSEAEAGPPMAFIGVRSCELRAIAIQDRVFLGGQHVDPVYAASVRARSWSPSTAVRPAGRASACRWRPGPRRNPASTWP